MALRGLRTVLGALTLVCFWATGGACANASTIYTYGFSQQTTVQIAGAGSLPGALSGSFTGTADAFGYINMATLTDFRLETSAFLYGAKYAGPPDFFSFQVGDTSGSTLAFQSPAVIPGSILDAQVCVGVAVAALCNGGTWRGVYKLVGATSNISTSDVAPLVWLISSTSTPPVATTPLPGAMLLFTTALIGAGVTGAMRHRRHGGPATGSALTIMFTTTRPCLTAPSVPA